MNAVMSGEYYDHGVPRLCTGRPCDRSPYKCFGCFGNQNPQAYVRKGLGMTKENVHSGSRRLLLLQAILLQMLATSATAQTATRFERPVIPVKNR